MEARSFFMDTLRKELSIKIWSAIGRHRLNRLDFIGISRADVQRMRDQNQQAFGMGGRVRGRRGPVTCRAARMGPAERPAGLRSLSGTTNGSGGLSLKGCDEGAGSGLCRDLP